MPDDDLSKAFQVKMTGVSRIWPEENTALILGPRCFLVSSGILSAASPGFAALFHSEPEGSQVTQRRVIRLPNTDPYALWIILAVLHHHRLDAIERHEPSPKQLLFIAIESSKFDCGKVLSAWIDRLQQTSMKNLPFSTAFFIGADADADGYHKEYAYKLAAAHYFRHAVSFKKISKRAILNLPISFNNYWVSPQMMEITQHLPNSLVYHLSNRIKELKRLMNVKIKDAYADLQKTITPYSMDYKECMSCGTVHPSREDENDPCANPWLRMKFCTFEHRLHAFKVAFEDVGLWDPVAIDPLLSMSDIVIRVLRAIHKQQHSCSAASSCPLQKAFEKLKPFFNTLCRCISGLELYPLHQSNEEFCEQDKGPLLSKKVLSTRSVFLIL